MIRVATQGVVLVSSSICQSRVRNQGETHKRRGIRALFLAVWIHGGG